MKTRVIKNERGQSIYQAKIKGRWVSVPITPRLLPKGYWTIGHS